MNQYPSEQQGIIISFLKVTSETKSKPFKCGICDKKFQRFMTGPILEKNHMLAIMVRKFQERNLLKGKALDFENLISKVYKWVCCRGFGF